MLGGWFTLETPGVCADAAAAGEAAGDVQDLFFLGGAETILVRFHIRIDDRPLNTAWRDAVASLHEYLDFNGTGTVARDEELADLAPILRVPLAVHPQLPPGSDQDTTFARIDANGDGMLGPDERDRAEEVLLKFDRNDDETVSSAELLALRDPNPGSSAQEDPGRAEALTLLLDRNASRIRAVQQVLNRFDTGGPGARPKDHRLGRSEIHLAAEVFRKFDNDHDGALDGVELRELLDRSDPTVELIVRLGSRPPGRPPLEFLDRRPAEPAAKGARRVQLRRIDATVVTIDLGDVWVDVRSEETSWNSARARQAFDRTFQDTDLDDSKSITVSEARGQQPFDRLFRLMDRNGDGRIVKEEMSAALSLIEDLWRGHAQLAVVDRGVQLFGNLDTSGDGRLGLRELRAASAQLASFDRNGDGKVAAAEIPHRFEWSFSQAPLPLGLVLRGGPDVEMRTPRGPASAAGPHWFQEMDRNRDGDLSPREFVGPRDAFLRLDENRDGLIDAREAAAASAGGTPALPGG
jgi:Ca2+-binding EF-hand superfamily protein